MQSLKFSLKQAAGASFVYKKKWRLDDIWKQVEWKSRETRLNGIIFKPLEMGQNTQTFPADEEH